MAYAVAEIARLVGGEIVGDQTLLLNGVNNLELAGPVEVSFVDSQKHFKEAEQSRAACLIVPPGFVHRSATLIVVEAPKLAFVKVMWLFDPARPVRPGIHPSAIVHPTATIPPDVSIGPMAIVGERAVIGNRVQIGSHAVIGEQVRVGADSVIFPNVTLYPAVSLGQRVIVHAGTVIGADGFGFVPDDGRHLKVPQRGTVAIEDDVEIGANCTIDRATFGATIIQCGTKTDNLVHIAHNVIIGQHTLIVAQVGIAGSSKIGHHVTLAGQSAVADNAVIGDHVTLAGRSAVISGQRVEPNQTVWGLPAKDIDEVKREIAALALLPKLLERVRTLERCLAAEGDPARQGKKAV